MALQRVCLISSVALLVAGCGGGGGDGDGSGSASPVVLLDSTSDVDSIPVTGASPASISGPISGPTRPPEAQAPAGGENSSEAQPPSGGEISTEAPLPTNGVPPSAVEPPTDTVPTTEQLPSTGTGLPSDIGRPVEGNEVEGNENVSLVEDAETVTYSVTLESLWLVDDYPQGFPDDAHLSHVGGATHNAAVSFWEPGTVVSRGMEDMAETGRIEILLADEVVPAIENGTADSTIAFREYVHSSTEALANGVDNRLTFELEMNRAWPRITLVTMLGPSPDWFVGVDGLALFTEGAWQAELSVDLPLYDGGSKSGMEPVMGGPDVIPPLPVAFTAYDAATGTYQPSETPQTIARLSFERLR